MGAALGMTSQAHDPLRPINLDVERIMKAAPSLRFFQSYLIHQEAFLGSCLEPFSVSKNSLQGYELLLYMFDANDYNKCQKC